MEIPQWLFFSFWAIISLTFLLLGFNAFDRTNLSKSVSPLIMFLFKHASAISVSHSIHYALVFRPGLLQEIDMTRHWFAIGNALNPIVFFGASAVMGIWYLLFCGLFTFFTIVMERRLSPVLEHRIGLEIDFVAKLLMYTICVDDHEKKINCKFYPTLVIVIAVCTSSIWRVVFDDEKVLAAVKEKESATMWKPEESSSEFLVGLFCVVFSHEENSSSKLKKMLYKRRKLIRFAVGMFGTIVFQNYFRVTSLDHVLAFLYLSVAWLGNIAMLGAYCDCGVLNFLMGNVIVGCTVSQFGLRGITWVAFGVSVLLFGLRLKIQSFNLLANSGQEEGRVINNIV